MLSEEVTFSSKSKALEKLVNWVLFKNSCQWIFEQEVENQETVQT